MDFYVKIAKQTIENYIKNKKIIKAPEILPEEFYPVRNNSKGIKYPAGISNGVYSRQAGVFVTIHRGKELRGCIGTYLPTKNNIAEEIVSNAVVACSRDYRFAPVAEEELSKLSFEVSILSEPELIKDLKNHDPKKHGIIVKCADGRCGLLLPDLEGVETTDQQIETSCQKGGINPEADNFELYEFTVEKHG